MTNVINVDFAKSNKSELAQKLYDDCINLTDIARMWCMTNEIQLHVLKKQTKNERLSGLIKSMKIVERVLEEHAKILAAERSQ